MRYRDGGRWRPALFSIAVYQASRANAALPMVHDHERRGITGRITSAVHRRRARAIQRRNVRRAEVSVSGRARHLGL
jgi:hypothetical protein